MKAPIALLGAAAFTALTTGATAPSAAPPASAPSASALPPGRPPLTAPSAAAALPPGHPAAAEASPATDGSTGDADDSDSELPAGHPSMDTGQAPKDTVTAAPDLAPGTIEVHVADSSGHPLPNFPVRLGLMRQDVATGNSHEDRMAATDVAGVVTFRGMPVGTEYSYRATVEQGRGVYASEPFRLDERTGQRALVHVYPVTSDIRQAMVGMRGVVFVQPREDIFQIEATIQVLNIGTIAWVPEGIVIPLPPGAKAFRANESMNDTRVEREKDGDVSLKGTFSPGEHEVTFQYQLENSHEPTLHFRMGLPPHMAEMRVYAEGPRDMQLNVSGFPKAERTTAQNGSRLLITGKRAVRDEPPIEDVEVSLENIPVPGQGRWYAAVLALCLAGFGIWNALTRRTAKEKTAPFQAELSEAEELVFRELVSLERLEREGEIGPRAYSEARAELLDVLSRLAARAERSVTPARQRA